MDESAPAPVWYSLSPHVLPLRGDHDAGRRLLLLLLLRLLLLLVNAPQLGALAALPALAAGYEESRDGALHVVAGGLPVLDVGELGEEAAPPLLLLLARLALLARLPLVVEADVLPRLLDARGGAVHPAAVEGRAGQAREAGGVEARAGGDVVGADGGSGRDVLQVGLRG